LCHRAGRPSMMNPAGALKAASLTASRHGSLCFAIRIKPQSDPATHSVCRGGEKFGRSRTPAGPIGTQEYVHFRYYQILDRREK
jgi:hypothetical protein